MNTEQYKLPGRKPSILALVMMISLASVGAILYTPSIPRLGRFFYVSGNTISFTMTLYLLGYALGQLIYGPLSNKLGRKNSLYFGICLAIISSIACGLSAPFHSLTLLMIARFFMAIGAGVGLTVTITIINDFYYSEQSRVIMPIIAMSFAIVPGIAIFFGGLITQYLSWPYCFYFLALYYFCALFVAMTLPETLAKRDPSALQIKSLIHDYWPLRKDWRLVGYAVLVGSATAFIYVFSTVGPIVVAQKFHFKAALYGSLAVIPSVCIVLGNFISSKLSKKFSEKQFIAFGITLMSLGSAALLLVVVTQHLTPFAFFFLISSIYLLNPMVWNSASVLATKNVENKANASAILSFINMSGAMVGVLVTGSFVHFPAVSMSIVYCVVAVLMILLAWRLAKRYA